MILKKRKTKVEGCLTDLAASQNAQTVIGHIHTWSASKLTGN